MYLPFSLKEVTPHRPPAAPRSAQTPVPCRHRPSPSFLPPSSLFLSPFRVFPPQTPFPCFFLYSWTSPLSFLHRSFLSVSVFSTLLSLLFQFSFLGLFHPVASLGGLFHTSGPSLSGALDSCSAAPRAVPRPLHAHD